MMVINHRLSNTLSHILVTLVKAVVTSSMTSEVMVLIHAVVGGRLDIHNGLLVVPHSGVGCSGLLVVTIHNIS